MSIDCVAEVSNVSIFDAWSMDSSYLGQLTLSLPRARQWVEVTTVKLARNISRNADTGGGGAGIGHGPGDVRSAIIEGRHRGPRGRRRGTASAIGIAIAKAQILNEAGERHDGGSIERVGDGGLEFELVLKRGRSGEDRRED